METLLAVVVAVLFATGAYLMLRPNLIRIVVGLLLLGNGVNLLVFTVADPSSRPPPLVPSGEVAPLAAVADPLPQAMILTAIVISFGLFVFTLVLAYRAWQAVGTLDPDAMDAAVPRDP